MTDYYVQTTSEVDWKCVTVSLTEPEPGVLTMVKSARLHSASDGVTVDSYPANYTIKDDHLVPYPPESTRRNRSFLIREAGPDLVVLTGRDDPSVYVWTSRDLYDYYAEDHLRIIGDLDLWGFATLDKLPLPSFTADCTFF
jgi:hypothetical protein